MTKEKMKCWICGDEATTGEHRIKHTDLKYLYPAISQKTPLYHRRDGVKQRKGIGSLNSNSLKFDTPICSRCNNEKTQKFDIAWQSMSNYLQKNWNKIINDNAIDLLEIFPKDVTTNLICVQLFFVKIFGCKIEESSSPIDLISFSEAILTATEHQNIYFSIRDSDIEAVGGYSSISDIVISYKDNNQNEIIYAHMFYTVGQVTIDLIYCLDTSCIDLNESMRPTQIINNTIPLSSCNYKDALPMHVKKLMKVQK